MLHSFAFLLGIIICVYGLPPLYRSNTPLTSVATIPQMQLAGQTLPCWMLPC